MADRFQRWKHFLGQSIGIGDLCALEHIWISKLRWIRSIGI